MKEWQPLKFDECGLTKWNWMCQYPENFRCGDKVDIGAFTYINARHGVEIGDHVQIGSHCSLYSHSTIDDKKGLIKIGKNARVGAHSTIMPGIVIGENAVVGAYSFVNKDIPDNAKAWGIPVKIQGTGHA